MRLAHRSVVRVRVSLCPSFVSPIGVGLWLWLELGLVCVTYGGRESTGR